MILVSNIAHLMAELERLRLFLRAQVWRARQLAGVDEGLHAFYIPEDEVDALLAKPAGQPFWNVVPLPEETVVSLQTALNVTEDQIAAQQKEAEKKDILLRLERLASLFELTSFDRDVLLVAFAPEIDLSFQRLYAYLHDDVTRKLPTIGLLLDLFGTDVAHKTALRQRFLPTNPLIAHQLISLRGETGQPQLAQTIALDPRIANYLLESDSVDGRLTPFITTRLPSETPPTLPFPRAFIAQLNAWLPSLSPRIQRLLYLQGAAGAGKQTLAKKIAHVQDKPLLIVNGRLLTQQSESNVATILPLILREALLQGAVLLWQDWDTWLAPDQTTKRELLLKQLNGRIGLTLLSGKNQWEPSGAVSYAAQQLSLPPLSVEERAEHWTAVLAKSQTTLEADDLADLAAKFRLTPGQIKAAVQTAQAHAQWHNPADPRLTFANLTEASRRHSNQLLADLAQKIIPHHDWDDLILPDLQRRQLRELCDQVKYHGLVYQTWGFDQKLSLGKGVNALFSGPPGTGKTMAAGILARELGLDLYKIDLSTVVSKFIGETEKNLSRIFAEAESSNAILFFDEADALFGKRTEVRDSHDRYANLEISYLLQRMEQYAGIVILASNLRKNMDEAFVRRMRFIVEFPFPTASERKRIWQTIWPKALPRAKTIDLDLLAEAVEVAGGNIRNIAVTAAFLAAANGQQVTMQHIEQATRREFQKMGKVLQQSLLPKD